MSIAILAWRFRAHSDEQRAEMCNVVVAYADRYIFDSQVGRLQQHSCSLHANFL